MSWILNFALHTKSNPCYQTFLAPTQIFSEGHWTSLFDSQIVSKSRLSFTHERLRVLLRRTVAFKATRLQDASGFACCAISPDGRRIAAGLTDRSVRIWDAETGILVGGPLRGHNDWVRSVAFSSDGMRIVSGSEDKTIRIWDAETGRPVGEPLLGHGRQVASVAFSPDPESKLIVSGSEDETIRIWDAKTGTPFGAPLQGHDGGVLSVAFSPDSTRIVSGSEDKTIRIWDVEKGRLVREPLGRHKVGRRRPSLFAFTHLIALYNHL